MPEHVIPEEDILGILKAMLPFYKRDDNDDFKYIAELEDLERVAKIIHIRAMFAAKFGINTLRIKYPL